MSSTVEERVVEMQFDNKQFESNAKETMKTLDALNKSLELKGATDGFKSLDKAAKSVDLSDISKSMDVITNKISVFGVIGDQVLRNLTNRATDFATKWAKDLTIGQVQKGWSKYEAKTNAVQVIMHATGQTIDEVNESLDDLTWYTDQTSYSFDQMIDAISKFTGAGIILDDAEKMAEGIANWAASAGVSASRAAPAFYNLSQAMSSGALRAQDWKSIELLNMNTVEFEEKAIEIAQAMIADGRASQEMATAFNKANPKVQGFRDSLSTGWLSKEVMTELFKAYADRTTEFGNTAFQAAYEAKSFTDAVEAAKEAVASGWANIFEQIFGNYEEAKVFWTEVADAMIEVFSAPTTALADLLTDWHKDGGYVAFIDSIRNAWAAVKSIGEEVAETFHNVIPPLTSDKLVSVTEKIENLTRQWRNFTTKIDISALIEQQDIDMLENGGKAFQEYRREIEAAEKHNAQVDKNMQSLRETFEGIFSVFKLAGTVVTTLFKIAVPFTRLLAPIARIIGSIASSLGHLVSNITDAILKSDVFTDTLGFLENIANKVAESLALLGDKVGTFIKNIKGAPVINKVTGFLTSLYTSVKAFAAPYLSVASTKIKELYGSLKTFSLSDFGSFLRSLTTWFTNLGKTAVGAAVSMASKVGPFFSDLWNYCKNLVGSLGQLGSKFKDFWKNTMLPINNIGASVSEVGGLSEKVGALIGSIVDKIRNGGIGDALKFALDKVHEFIWQIRHIEWGAIFDRVFSSLAIIRVLKLIKSFDKTVKLFGDVWKSVGDTIRSTISQIGTAFSSFSGFMTSLGVSIKDFTKKLTKGLVLKRLAVSLLMLAVSLYVLSKIPKEDLTQLAITLGALAAGLVIFAIGLSAAEGFLAKSNLSNPKGVTRAIASMLVIALSAVLLASALKKISEIGDFTLMMQSVVALLAVVAILVAGSAIISLGSVSLEKLGIGVLALVAAVLLVVFALDKIKEAFTKMKDIAAKVDKQVYGTLGIMLGLVVGMAVATIAAKKIESSLWQVAVTLLAVGVSLYLIGASVKKLSSLNADSLAQAGKVLLGLVLAMGALALLSRVFSKPGIKGLLGMATAILSVSIAVGMIVGVLAVIALIGPDKINSAIETLASVLGMLSVLLVAAGFVKPQTGGAIRGLATVIGVLVAALVILTYQDYNKIMSAAVMLGISLLVVMTALSIGSRALNSSAGIKTAIALGGIILAVTAALLILSRIDSDRLITASLGLGNALFAFAFTMFGASKAMANMDLRGLAMSILIIVAIGWSLYSLATLPVGNIISAAAGMATVLAVLSFTMRSISKTGMMDGNALQGMFGIAILLIAIAGTLAALTFVDTGKLIASTIAMVTVLLVLALVIPIIGRMKVPNGWESLKIAGFIAAVLVPIAAVLGLLAATKIDANRIVAMATAMAEVMVALAAPIAAIGLLGMLGGKAMLAGTIGFVAIVTALGAAFWAIGSLVEYLNSQGKDIVGKIESAKEVMLAIGGTLGSLIGGFFTSFGNVVFDSIASWGEDIKTFLSSLSEGVDGLNQLEIDEGKMSALESFGNAILTITKAEILDGITSWITGGPDFTKFADGIAKMAPALKTFATETEGLDSTKIEPAAKAIESLSNVAKNLGRTGGVFEGLTGKAKSLGDFASDMSKAAPKLNKFAQEMSKEDGFAMKDDKVIAAANAIKAMSDVAQSLGTTGGILEHIRGKARSLADFAGELKETIPDLQAFAAAAPGLASAKADIEKVAGAIGAMIEVANALVPEHEENFWSGHVKDAQTLGEFFAAFSDSGIEASANLGSLEARFKIEGKKGITSSLIEFANQMATINMAGLDNGVTAIQKLIEIGNTFAGDSQNIEILGGLFSIEKNTGSGLSHFADELNRIAPTFIDFSGKLDGLNMDNFDLFANAVKNLANAEVWLSNLEYGGGTMETFAAELARSAENFALAATTAEAAPLDALEVWFTWLNDNYEDLLLKGKNAIKAVQDGMNTAAALGAIDVANKTVNPVMDAIASATNELKAKAAGKFLVDGFAAGITANIRTAMAAAGNLAESTIQQMRRTLRIGSPSRVARQIGDWTGEGFTIGVSDWLHASGQVGDSLAESVTKSAEATVDYLSRLLNGDMVVSMTIHPVLDLTDVRNGAMTIDSMFTQRQALMAQMDSSALDQSNEIAELLNVSWQILREIQNGRDIYLDGRVLAGSMNRRLGRMEGL